MSSIDHIPKSDRPREKLQGKGPQALSDRELLAILLGTGTQKLDVMAMADQILKVLGDKKEAPSLEDLQIIPGMGPAKAMVIAAALEFARRRIRPEGVRVTFYKDVLPLIQHYADRKQEHFLCITLNGASEVIKTRVISVGSSDRAPVQPRDVFADAVADRAAAVILAHNHPVSSVEPSREDIELTKRLVEAGQMLGIKVLDHIIFNQRGHLSLNEGGYL